MIVFAGILAGLIGGPVIAGRHGGTRADKVQYALAMAIAGALVGLIVTLIVENLLA